jgi:hypothetical protein
MIIANVHKNIGTFKFQITWTRYSHFSKLMGKTKKSYQFSFKKLQYAFEM